MDGDQSSNGSRWLKLLAPEGVCFPGRDPPNIGQLIAVREDGFRPRELENIKVL